MIETIEDRRVKHFLTKNSEDPFFEKWTDLPWSQQIIFILKEIVNENFELKRQVRELKGEMVEEVKESEAVEEPEVEPEEIEKVVQEQIIEPIEPEELEEAIEPKIEEKAEPIEISEFVCPECNKKFPNKGLLNSHIKRMHKREENEEPA